MERKSRAVVAVYEGAYERLAERLDALSLDIEVITYDDGGQFTVDGELVAPREVDVDFLWLSVEAAMDGAMQGAFTAALECRSLGVLQVFLAGLDSPAFSAIADRGTRVCNSIAQGVAIAEYVMAQALSVIHPVDLQRELQGRKEWQRTPFRELSRMTWVIVGFGPIGQGVAQRVKSFGASTTVIRRSPTLAEHIDVVDTLDNVTEHLPAADVIVLACPLNEATSRLANAEFFAHVKPGAILINVARGGLVDEAALLAALDSGRLSTAVLDAFDTEPLPADSPLWEHPGVRLTAHTAFNGDGMTDRWDAQFLENVERFVNGDALIREVDPATLRS